MSIMFDIFRKVSTIHPFHLLLIIMSFVFPFYQKIIPPIIIIAIAAWIFLLFRFRTIHLEFHAASLLFIALYLWHVVSLLWSSDVNFALFDLTVKASFVIFPLLTMIQPLKYPDNFVEKLLAAFVAGNVISVILSLLVALWNAIQGPVSDTVFFYDSFALFHHPAYMGLYLNFSLIIVLYFHQKKRISGGLTAIVCFLLLAGITLTLARTAIITAFLIITGYMVMSIRHFSISQIVLSVTLLLLVLTIALIASRRFERFQWKHYAYLISGSRHADPSTHDTRFYTFKAAQNVFREHWLIGCGAGDIHTEMQKQYQSMQFEKGIRQRLNAHNQFLQTAATLGLPGLILLIAIYAVLIVLSLKHYQPLPFLFAIIVILASLTESILEKQSGIVFIAFFSNFLFLKSADKNK